MTTNGALTNSGQLRVDDGGNGGSSLTLGGSLTNNDYMQLGNYYITSPSNVKVNGTLTNTNTVQVDAGNASGANALLNITGAAPATLTGTYQMNAYASSSAVEWGSGGITSIGDGVSNAGNVDLSGSLASQYVYCLRLSRSAELGSSVTDSFLLMRSSPSTPISLPWDGEFERNSGRLIRFQNPTDRGTDFTGRIRLGPPPGQASVTRRGTSAARDRGTRPILRQQLNKVKVGCCRAAKNVAQSENRKIPREKRHIYTLCFAGTAFAKR